MYSPIDRLTQVLILAHLLLTPFAWADAPSADRQFCQQHGLIQSEPNRSVLYTLDYFGTSITIEVLDNGGEDAATSLCESLRIIERYHRLASDYDTYPGLVNIKSINLAPTQTHRVEPELFEMIESGIEWHRLSRGYFNIAIGPVVQLWRQHRFRCNSDQPEQRECSLPSDAELRAAAQRTRIDAIRLDAASHSITMAEGMSLDLGGIAKGWMVERVLNHLRERGMRSVVINAGGNIRHYGLHPEGRPFVTAIEDPVCRKHQFQLSGCERAENRYGDLIKGENLTVVTSGNYLKYFEVDGKEYHHIIDPTTLYPKRGGVATSVVLTANHIYADVLSTTLFLMPLDQARALAEKLDYLEAVWVLDENRNEIHSSGFEHYFAP
ncbi:FAD:protein FMN transferase [Ferrimonas sediminicola]|uniref:FAD:protein FMN transferase n=1 Tax=Ferrimonas sediminicola TaxID=2569538 RepID=A0A4U1BBX7_9GAMM|nr:FAD:protein FMN transferase [Ferrimonas sediminicola]TKB48442.1 FAD:protein FMN transferase [Ferrimonas sediminicola]